MQRNGMASRSVLARQREGRILSAKLPNRGGSSLARSERSCAGLLAASTAWLLAASCLAEMPLAAARRPFAFVNSTSQLKAGAVRTLEEPHRFTRTRWSPDSSLIVACNWTGIWVAEATGGAFAQVVDGLWDELCMPAWSADSRNLAYVDRCGVLRIVQLERKGNRVRAIRKWQVGHVKGESGGDEPDHRESRVIWGRRTRTLLCYVPRDSVVPRVFPLPSDLVLRGHAASAEASVSFQDGWVVVRNEEGATRLDRDIRDDGRVIQFVGDRGAWTKILWSKVQPRILYGERVFYPKRLGWPLDQYVVFECNLDGSDPVCWADWGEGQMHCSDSPGCCGLAPGGRFVLDRSTQRPVDEDPNCLKDFIIYDSDSSVRRVFGPGESGPPYKLKKATPLGINRLMDSCFWGGEWSPDGKSVIIGDSAGLYVVSVEMRAGEE